MFSNIRQLDQDFELRKSNRLILQDLFGLEVTGRNRAAAEKLKRSYDIGSNIR